MYNMQIRILFTIFMLLYITQYVFAATDTTRIYFRLDNPALEEQALKKIDSLIYYDIINASQELLIIGYADHLGTGKYNDALSEKRANSVKDYLVSMNIPAKNVTLVVGRGEVPRDVELPKGYAADRRVDIVLLSKQKNVIPVAPVAKKKEPVAELTQSKDAIPLNRTTVLRPENITVGQLFVLDKIFFYTGMHRVVRESQPELEKIYEVMEENPTLTIRIEGHVCCVHPSMDALDIETGKIALSVNRAKYIYNYLVKKGIEESRLSYEGFGKTRPLSKTEFTEEEQNLNKRVEIRILKK